MESFHIVSCFLLVCVISLSCIDGYDICGDDIDEEKVAMARDEVIKRILELRNADRTWDNYGSTELALLVAAPSNFTKKSKTMEVLKQRVKNNYNKMTIRQISTIAFALKGQCENNRDVYGLDLLKIVEARLQRQFPKKITIPKDGYGYYSIGLGVLCGSEYQIPPRLVNNLINAQNKDGSFGKHSNSDSTTIGPALYCLSRMSEPKFSIRKLENAITKLRKYLISQVSTDENGKTWIGDEVSSEMGVLTLWKTQPICESYDNWKCNDVMESLGLEPKSEEDIVKLERRLLRLSGAVYSDVMDPDWQCD